MFVVDLMHDFELGNWRALFIHLLRILDTMDGNLLMELDRRYDALFFRPYLLDMEQLCRSGSVRQRCN